MTTPDLSSVRSLDNVQSEGGSYHDVILDSNIETLREQQGSITKIVQNGYEDTFDESRHRSKVSTK